MSSLPVSQEIAGAVAAYFFGGSGPSLSKLTSVFLQAGYGDAAPSDGTPQSPNKETRVQLTVMAAVRRPERARSLVDGILTTLRLGG